MNKKDFAKIKRGINISDEDFFRSNAYKNYMKNSISIFCSKYGYEEPVEFEISESKDVVAYTNFKKIVISSRSKFLDSLSVKEKFEMTKGLLAHELSHVFFTERYAVMADYGNLFSSLYPYIKDSSIEEEEKKEIVRLLEEKIYNGEVEKEAAVKRIFNIVEDGFIEDVFLTQNSGLSKNALLKVRAYHYKKMKKAATNLSEKEVGDELLSFNRMLDACLCYAKYKRIHPFYQKKQKEDVQKVLDEEKEFLVKEIFPYIKKALLSTKGADRELYKFMVYIALEKKIKSMERSAQDSVFEEARKKEEDMDLLKRGLTHEEIQKMKNMGPKNLSDLSLKDFSLDEGEDVLDSFEGEGVPMEGAKGPASGDFERVFDEAVETIAEEIARKEIRNKEKLRSLSFSKDGIKTLIHFPKGNQREEYRDILKKVHPISRRMQRKFLEKLRERKLGFTEKNLYLGKTIEKDRLYREDGKLFSKKTLPSDIADLCVGILVDESGSMIRQNGGYRRIYYAKKTAILLDDFCRGLEIPHTVYGHTADNGSDQELNMIPYIPFDGPEFLKYSMTEISARKENRDGHAIEYIARQVKERPERKKIIFCITDGVPYANQYSGEKARRHTRDIIKKYSRDILFIGLCIAEESQKKEIASMYDKMLFIKDLNDLPKTAIRLIAKHI